MLYFYSIFYSVFYSAFYSTLILFILFDYIEENIKLTTFKRQYDLTVPVLYTFLKKPFVTDHCNCNYIKFNEYNYAKQYKLHAEIDFLRF